MKHLKILATLALLFVVHTAIAKTTKPVPASEKLSTDVSFDGHVVKGKYQYSSEAVTTVENEKGIDDLIGVRKNFKDRLNKSEDLR